MRRSTAILCVLLVLYGVPAQAESPGSAGAGTVGIPSSAKGIDLPRPWPPPSLAMRRTQAGTDPASGDIERRIAELKFDRDGIDLRGPRAALIAGSVTTGIASTFLMLVGGLCGDCGSAGRLYGTSGGFLFAGLVTLGTSLAVLVPRRRRVRAIDREILDLQYGPRARAASAWSLSFDPGKRKTLSLALRF